jgi:hypothetical protein
LTIIYTVISDGLYEWFGKWSDKPVHERGADYKALKSKLAYHLLDVLNEVVPEVQGKVDFSHFATPFAEESGLGSYSCGAYDTLCTPYARHLMYLATLFFRSVIQHFIYACLLAQDAFIPFAFHHPAISMITLIRQQGLQSLLLRPPTSSDLLKPRSYLLVGTSKEEQVKEIISLLALAGMINWSDRNGSQHHDMVPA